MTTLPALVTRPLVDAYADALGASPGPLSSAPPGRQVLVQAELTDGIPARLTLDASRSLVLAVPVGVARAWLDADPLAVVVDDAAVAASPPGERVPVDLPRPRLTLVVDGHIADTVVVVARVPVRLGDGQRALVELVVDRLVLTVGSMRGPGRFDSRIAFRWTDLTEADATGPAPVAHDPALDLLRSAGR